MKKLLLGLGVLPLLTLPVIGLVSCGQPQKSKLQNKIDEPTLQNQIDKLEDSITKDPNATTNQVLNDINGALDIDGRKRELEKVFTLPELDLGFSISQIIPTIEENNKTNLSVEITIQKDSSPTDTLSKTIVISGLKAITPKEITSKEPTKQPTPKEPTKETTPKETTKNLDITAIPSTQAVIDEVIKEYKAARTNKIRQLASLKQIFVGSGLTLDHLENLIVKIIDTFPRTINLTAKPGFTINGSRSISSSLKPAPITPIVPTIVDLKIISLPSTQAVIDKAIATYKGAMLEQQKVNALSKVFLGVKIDNLANFDVSATVGTTRTPGKIVLIAKQGFIFGASKTLSSLLAPIVYLNITAKPSTQEVIDKAITDFTSGTNESEKIIALSTIFSGIKPGNFKHITIATTSSTITLMANSGFSINGKQTISSSLAPIVDLKITAIPSTQPTIDKAIRDFKSRTNESAKITALSTLFDGITSETFKNITIATISSTITLTANSGFSINGKQTISSDSSKLVDLNITTKPSTQVVIYKALEDFIKVRTWELQWPSLGNQDDVKIAVLSTVFDGITVDNFKNITITATPTSGFTVRTIILTANSGFTFNGKERISSIVDLKITAKKTSTKETIDQAIKDFVKTRNEELSGARRGNHDVRKIAALSTVFDGITRNNFKNFDVQATPLSGKIILTANSGFSFNGKERISSIVDLKITAIPSTQASINKAIVDFNKPGANDTAKITALSIVFDGITSETLKNIDVVSKSSTIILSPKLGFTIDGNSSLYSNHSKL